MIQRIKTLILSTLAAGLLLVPALPSVAFAAEADIESNLCNGANLSLNPGAECVDDGTDAQAKVDNIIKLVINIFSLVVGVVSVIMIIIGGLKYITSGGEGSNITGAKNTIMYAIIGLVVVALAQVIVRFVLAKTAGAGA
jgi:cytochrome bd-type quinol oxidase subunit 2